VPQAALAGVLLYVASRIVRLGTIRDVVRQAPIEALLILITMAAVDLLPIPTGVAIGIALSLGHGAWLATKTKPVEYLNVPGTTIWWPRSAAHEGQTLPGVLVAGFPAPLLFANAEPFRRDMLAFVERHLPLRLFVLEGSGIADIDYTAAQAVCAVIESLRKRGIDIALARLESVRAHQSLEKFKVLEALGSDNVYLSVAEAVAAHIKPARVVS
jgi:sulfate permease, SulP family